MVVSKAKKGCPRKLTARLLVLGDKQVGKSASIVRYTTGRYIQEYSGSTNDWLYQHSLGFEAKQNAHLSVELLEQRDIQFSSSSNFFTSSHHLSQHSNANGNNQYGSSSHQSLASRVALDQQIDNEFQEKQQLLSKLHWAGAYVVVYAINDISTFNKAIKYLNLIANHINSPPRDHHHNQKSTNSHSHNGSNSNHSNSNQINGSCHQFYSSGSRSSSGSTSSSSSCGGPSVSSNSSSNSNLSNVNSNGKFIAACANRLSPSSNGACSCSATKRPILLLANKQDLDIPGQKRQVSPRDGRLLAMRHQSMFAEVSAAQSHRTIKAALATLIEQIDPVNLHVESIGQVIPPQQKASAKISHWRPTIELALNQSSINLTAPVWGNLVKSQMVGSTVVQSSRIAPVSRLEPTDVRLITPLGSVSKSMESGRLTKPVAAQSIDIIGKRCELELSKPPKAAVAQRLTSGQRYENLKTSFKRASMAINAVGSKTLGGRNHSSSNKTYSDNVVNKVGHQTAVCSTETAANNSERALPPKNTAPETSTTEAQQKVSKVSTASGSNAPASWIKSHIRLSRDRNSPASSSDSKLDAFESLGAAEEKGGRALFKYKNRRKTVAFEPISGVSCGNGSAGGRSITSSIVEVGTELSKLPDRIMQAAPQTSELGGCNSLETSNQIGSSGQCSDAYNSNRSSSGRSSSSLSTDAYYSASLASWSQTGDRAPSSVGSTSVRSSNYASTTAYGAVPVPGSQSTLSRASFSGTSRADSGDDQAFADHKAAYVVETCQGSIAPETSVVSVCQLPTLDLTANASVKKKYHLVKTMQSTLTNLTRSSNVSAQAAKKSFCNVLFRQTNQGSSLNSDSSAGSVSVSPAAAVVVRNIIPQAPVVSLHKTEQILAMPPVGFCQ